MAVQYTPAQYANFQKAVTPYLLHRHVFFLDILKSHLVEFWKKHYKNVFCDCKCCQFAYLCYRNLATKTTVPLHNSGVQMWDSSGVLYGKLILLSVSLLISLSGICYCATMASDFCLYIWYIIYMICFKFKMVYTV